MPSLYQKQKESPASKNLLFTPYVGVLSWHHRGFAGGVLDATVILPIAPPTGRQLVINP
jgi:hypothetical protein